MRPLTISGFFLGVMGVQCGAAQIESAAASRPSPSPFTVSNSETRILPRTGADRQYQLQIGLPNSYALEPHRKYPVVFVTDGYYDFTTVFGAYGNLAYDRTVPDMLVVGLGYAGEHPDFEKLRLGDLLPLPSMGGDPSVGHAAEFLRMIETVAIPLLERDYRADPHYRVLMGCSAGGCFTLYSMYAKPGLFQAYVAASPAVFEIWTMEEAFAHSGRPLAARLLMTVGSDEWAGYRRDVLRFNELLSKRDYLKGRYLFREIDGMRHAGEKSETYARGLQYAFAPIAPETGPNKAQLFNSQRPQYLGLMKAAHLLTVGATRTEADIGTMRRHREYLKVMCEEKKFLTASAADDTDPTAATVILLEADTLQEAHSLVFGDPAVAAGLMSAQVNPY